MGKANLQARRKRKLSAFDIISTVVLALFAVMIIFPFWDMIVRSFSDPRGANSLGVLLWPKNFTISSYQYVFSDQDIIMAFGVTVARTVIGTVVSLLLVMMAAYGLSKKNLPFHGLITTLFIVPLFFTGGTIPVYLVIRAYNLMDSFLVYILPTAVGVYNVILARNYLMSIDTGIEESAFIDGAGYGTIFFRIIFPLSKPIVATLALWIAVAHWNAWVDCMMYIRSKDLMVVQMVLRKLMEATNEANEAMLMFMEESVSTMITSTSVRMAATVVTIVPIIVVYPFLQKYFVKGIMVGAIKG